MLFQKEIIHQKILRNFRENEMTEQDKLQAQETSQDAESKTIKPETFIIHKVTKCIGYVAEVRLGDGSHDGGTHTGAGLTDHGDAYGIRVHWITGERNSWVNRDDIDLFENYYSVLVSIIQDLGNYKK